MGAAEALTGRVRAAAAGPEGDARATGLARDRAIVARYTRQPDRLPPDLRARLEEGWDDDPVQLYALADLDHGFRLAEMWVALGPSRIALARRDPKGSAWLIRDFSRRQVTTAREQPGLSGTTLTILGAPGDPALAVVRYTHRQRRAFENLRFVLEERLGEDGVVTEDADEVYAEAVARPIREAQALVARRRVAVLWRLLGYLRPYRRQLSLGMAAATAITLMSLLPPWLTGLLLNRLVAPADEGALPVQQAAVLAWLVVSAMGLVYLVRQGAALIRLRLMAIMGELVARDLRTELYEHLQRLGLSYYSRKKTGSLITRVTSDTDRLWEFLAIGIVDVSLSVVMLVGLGVVLVLLDWRLGLAMIVPVPLFCWLIYRHGTRLNRLFLRAWRKWSRVTDVLSDTIPGVRVVKAFDQQDREVGRFVERNRDVTDEFNRIHRVWSGFWPLLMLGVHGTTVLVWVLAVPRLLGTAGPPLALGTFVAFLLYATMFIAPLEVIGQITRMMNRATTSAHRVFEVLDTEPDLVVRTEPIRLEPVRGRVTFEQVGFAYDGIRQVLRSVSFDVQPGELVGLVGASGGGKTTVVSLIARFYDVTGGSVKIDGVDVRDLDIGCVRRQIGMVLQDPYLFHGTILENIRYPKPNATLEEVIAAARAANAHDFIVKLAHGYETVVGERGQTLSGGERQRVSIARAVLHDPRILILDEATSSVDTETERHIQDALDRLVQGRTVFAIAHRLSTLRRASRLFVIEEGRIVEEGKHMDLLARENGRYRRLAELQASLG
jgi:ATP-binding cassette, subfamily B, bacterial